MLSSEENKNDHYLSNTYVIYKHFPPSNSYYNFVRLIMLFPFTGRTLRHGEGNGLAHPPTKQQVGVKSGVL